MKRAKAVQKITQRELPLDMRAGIVRAVRGQFIDVLLAGGKHVKDVGLARGITAICPGWWVVVVRTPRSHKWVAIAVVEDPATGSRRGSGTLGDLVQPASVTATAKPYMIELSWAGTFKNIACYEVLHNSSESETGATTLKIEGANYFYWCAAGTQRYFKVRSVSSDFERSSWSGWVNATALGGAQYKFLDLDAALGPQWSAFDWDNVSGVAGADMVHNHHTAAEGGVELWPDRLGVGTASIPAFDGVIGLPEVVSASVPTAPNEGRIYCADVSAVCEFFFKDDQGRAIQITSNGVVNAAGAGGNTLDGAYDQGGAGAGRQITADSGAVDLLGAGGLLSEGNVVLDDGAGNSPELRFVGGSNDDTIKMVLIDDPDAGESDFGIYLAGDVSSAFALYNNSGTRLWYFESDGHLYQEQGGITTWGNVSLADGWLYVAETDPAVKLMRGNLGTTANPDSVHYPLHLQLGWASTAGLVVPGFGVGIEFGLHSDSEAVEDIGAIDFIWTDCGDGTEDGAIIFELMLAGAARAQIARLDADTGFILDDGAGDSPALQFIGGSNDDTISFHLADDVDAGESDLYLTLAGSVKAAAFTVRKADLTDVLTVYGSGAVEVLCGNLVVTEGQFTTAFTAADTVGAANIRKATATTNAVTEIIKMQVTTSGTAAAGFGGRVMWELEDAGGSGYQDAGTIDVVWIDPADGSEDSAMLFGLVAAGAAITENLRLQGKALRFSETTDPGNVANTGWLYVKDDGGGNTELYYEDEGGTVSKITPPFTGEPSGIIVLWDNSDSCPAGYTEIAGAANRVIYIVAGGPGGVGGATSHYHTLGHLATYYSLARGQPVGNWSGGQPGGLYAYSGVGGAETLYFRSMYSDYQSHLYAYYTCVICEKN